MSKYTIASEEGAQLYGREIGDQVEIDDPERERALIAAGWIDDKKPKEAKK